MAAPSKSIKSGKWNVFEVNAECKGRKPAHSDVTHIVNMPTFLDANGKMSFNQYTKPKSDTAWFDAGYQYLMYRVQEEQLGLFTCWIPSGPGIDAVQTDEHYKRMNLNGSSPQCHGFVWAYHHPGVVKNLDVSHLCGNGFCCRPSHLHHEERKYQLLRRGCPGYLCFTDADDIVTYYLACKHMPICKRSTSISFEDVCEEPADN